MRIRSTLLSAALLACATLAGAGLAPAPARAETKYLAVPPRQTAVTAYNWARVAEMLLIHYRFADLHPTGDYVCGLAGLAFSGNTGSCPRVAGLASMAELKRVVEEHEQLAAPSARQPVRFFSLDDAGYPRYAQFRAEIDRDRPVVIGLASVDAHIRQNGSDPKTTASVPHFALVVGYDDGRGLLLVNDPVLYRGLDNPLLQRLSPPARPGQYWVRYNDLVELGWWGTMVSRPAGSFGVPARGQDRYRDSFRDPRDGREPRFGSIYYKDSTLAR